MSDPGHEGGPASQPDETDAAGEEGATSLGARPRPADHAASDACRRGASRQSEAADGEGVPGWLRCARAAASMPPVEPRRPLHVVTDAGPTLVGSIEPLIAERLVAAGLPLRGAGDSWHVDAPATPSLAAIAGALRDLGLAGGWRNELLDVVDAADHRPLAAVERAVVRVLGLTTFAVHLVGHAHDGRVWVQQRAFDKATDPGLWDTLVGGQVGAGETVEQALERETSEEAGLDLADLLELRCQRPLTIRRPVAEGYMIEHLDVYTARVPAGVAPCNRDGEVERFECLDRSTLDQRLAGGDFTLEASLILAASRPPL